MEGKGNGEETILEAKRGMIKIKNTEVECYLGNKENMKLSKDVMEDLKDNIRNYKYIEYSIGEEKYNIIFPIPNKKISI